MSDTVAIQLKRKFAADVAKKFPPVRLRYAARQVARREIELIRERTQRGLDTQGRPFSAYSSTYVKAKQRIIKQGWRVRRGRGRNARLVSLNPTAFAANRVGDWMRLSGRMFSDMYVKAVNVIKQSNGYAVTYTLDFKTARSKAIAEYHNITGAGKGKVLRKFWGGIADQRGADDLRRTFARALRD